MSNNNFDEYLLFTTNTSKAVIVLKIHHFTEICALVRVGFPDFHKPGTHDIKCYSKQTPCKIVYIQIFNNLPGN